MSNRFPPDNTVTLFTSSEDFFRGMFGPPQHDQHVRDHRAWLSHQRRRSQIDAFAQVARELQAEDRARRAAEALS